MFLSTLVELVMDEKGRRMTEGITCYERDEELCEDQWCLRVGCVLRNKRLSQVSSILRLIAWEYRMISLSHWGMFPRPRLVLVLPALSSEDMARLEEEMKRPGNIVEIKHDVTPQWISPGF